MGVKAIVARGEAQSRFLTALNELRLVGPNEVRQPASSLAELLVGQGPLFMSADKRQENYEKAIEAYIAQARLDLGLEKANNQ